MRNSLEGMVRAFDEATLDYYGQEPSNYLDEADIDGMKAALLWLADNVTTEMVIGALDQCVKYMSEHNIDFMTPKAGESASYTRAAIAATLRKVAE